MATDTAQVADEAGTRIADLLTVDGFDFDQVIAYIENSELATTVKATTKAALEQARDNPDALRDVLDTLRTRLGVE
jgi:hypothetical protein